MTVLVTGGRDFDDYEFVQISRLVHGAASGADTLAGRWTREHGVEEVAGRPIGSGMAEQLVLSVTSHCSMTSTRIWLLHFREGKGRSSLKCRQDSVPRFKLA